MIVVHAAIPIDPDRLEEARDLVATLAERSRTEPGVVEYRAAADLEDSNLIRIFERYESEADLAEHAETAHFEAFRSAIPDLLAGESEIHRFHVDEVSE